VSIRLLFCLFLLFFGLRLQSESSSPGSELATPQTPEKDYPVGVLTAKGRVSVEGRVQFTAKRKFLDPLLYSGNKIRVAEGQAKLDLVLGGSIKLCNESELAILQGHSPYLFTLSKGAIYFELTESRGDTFFTPDFLVQTEVAASSKPAAFRGEIAVETGGVICVRSLEGQLRLTAQSNRGVLTIPAGASIRLSPGEIKPESVTSNQSCSCESPLTPRGAQDLIMSLQPGQRKRSLLGKFFRGLAHILTFGLI